MRRLLPSFILVFALFASVASADPNYVTPDQVDLTKLLAPAPALDSEQQARDLMKVLAVQKSRTPQQAERALGDAGGGAFRFDDVLGPAFTPEHLPKLVALLENIRADANILLAAGKDAWNRPRPFAISSQVEPLGARPSSSSYPSSNAMTGYLIAIVLANMVPEKSAALFERGREYGNNRVVIGVHYPSDVEAGRLAATAIATGLMQSPGYRRDFAEAKSELRRVLGLPAN
jgi:acid phosphatase (class A)